MSLRLRYRPVTVTEIDRRPPIPYRYRPLLTVTDRY
jgi:hypothetical protein